MNRDAGRQHVLELSAGTRAAEPAFIPRVYRCQCGNRVFFRNSACLACGTPLGFVPSRRRICAIRTSEEQGRWCVVGEPRGASYARCLNFRSAAACNWLIGPEDGRDQAYCRACRLNRTIPDLSMGRNAALWLCMERAKRRLISQLVGLDLPVLSKVTEDPKEGLAYDFLQSLPGRPRVLTGHSNGVITINLEEADDVVREKTRIDMGEPYRTLLGHFRHEVGHYYWERLIRDGSLLVSFRDLFGDERADYAAALKRNYESGPPASWNRRFVSAYASVHPSEDWAETWAHYLHVRDTLDTASSFGIEPGSAEPADFGVGDLWQPQAANARSFLRLLQRWIRITGVMNEMSRAMGQHDFYPFVLPRAAVAKLHFIHCVVSREVPVGASTAGMRL